MVLILIEIRLYFLKCVTNDSIKTLFAFPVFAIDEKEG